MEPSLTLGERLDRTSPLAVRQRALIELVSLASLPLQRFVQGRHVPAQDQKDICNDAMLLMIQKVIGERYDCTLGDPISYLIGIAAKLIRRPTPAAKREEALPEDMEIATPDNTFQTTDATIDVDDIAARLTHPEDRAVLAMIRAEYTITEMAKQFECSYKTAWRRFHRCLDNCRILALEGAE
jgi:DNA-directed RNA polymerase specialized sigma24 family protein